jgi:hypothetical protein
MRGLEAAVHHLLCQIGRLGSSDRPARHAAMLTFRDMLAALSTLE